MLNESSIMLMNIKKLKKEAEMYKICRDNLYDKIE